MFRESFAGKLFHSRGNIIVKWQVGKVNKNSRFCTFVQFLASQTLSPFLYIHICYDIILLRMPTVLPVPAMCRKSTAMELNEKLQELRKQRGLTQEELAGHLFVSRTAVSKWESGRGYPNIDSLKAAADFFGVTVDQLLSGEELLTIAQKDLRQKEGRFCGLVFGLLDCSNAMLFWLPLFGQTTDGMVQEVSLFALTQPQPWLKAFFFAVVMAMIAIGVLTLALQSHTSGVWAKSKYALSLGCNVLEALIFILSRQPYTATFAFVFLIIKALVLTKKR